jgi:hypothetical protein
LTSDNKLGGLDADFFRLLTGLEWLDLRNNRLTALPSFFHHNRYIFSYKIVLVVKNLQFLYLVVHFTKSTQLRNPLQKLQDCTKTPRPLLHIPLEKISKNYVTAQKTLTKKLLKHLHH